MGFTAAFHFRVSVKKQFWSFRKANNFHNNGSITQKWSTIAQRVNLGPTLTGDWEGQVLGRAQAGELCKKNLVSLPNHILCWKKKSVLGKNIWMYFGFKFTITGTFRKHSIYFNIYWRRTYLVSLQMRRAKPHHFILYHWFVFRLLYSFPCIRLLCILFPALEDAQSLEGQCSL